MCSAYIVLHHLSLTHIRERTQKNQSKKNWDVKSETYVKWWEM